MDANTKAVFDAALALPEAERAALVEQLLLTLSPDDDMTDEELAAELERRLDEYRNDPSTAVPWSRLKEEELGN